MDPKAVRHAMSPEMLSIWLEYSQLMGRVRPVRTWPLIWALGSGDL